MRDVSVKPSILTLSVKSSTEKFSYDVDQNFFEPHFLRSSQCSFFSSKTYFSQRSGAKKGFLALSLPAQLSKNRPLHLYNPITLSNSQNWDSPQSTFRHRPFFESKTYLIGYRVSYQHSTSGLPRKKGRDGSSLLCNAWSKAKHIHASHENFEWPWK